MTARPESQILCGLSFPSIKRSKCGLGFESFCRALQRVGSGAQRFTSDHKIIATNWIIPFRIAARVGISVHFVGIAKLFLAEYGDLATFQISYVVEALFDHG